MSLPPSRKHLGEELYIDTESGALYLNGDLLAMGPQLARVLRVLYERRSDFTKPDLVQDLAWSTPTVTTGNPYQAKKSLNDLFTACGIQHLIWIETRTGWGYRLTCPNADIELPGTTTERVQGAEDCPREQLEHKFEISETVASQATAPVLDTSRNSGQFVLSIDGIILNAVGELIFGSVEEETVRKCSGLYKSAIEDFAFAVVYGSHLRSKWLPGKDLPAAQLSKGDPDVRLLPEPAEGVIARLPDHLYSTDPVDDKFGFGRVLLNDQGRERVSEYIRALAEAAKSPGSMAICRQWIAREADLYLGNHPSLFKDSDDPGGFRFQKGYYDEGFLQRVPELLGEDVLERMVRMLPAGPQSGLRPVHADKFSRSALRQFVINNVLTHITVMYEYELSAEASHAHRLPFALRGAVKRQWNADHRNQRILRRLLVTSALNEALAQSADAHGREALVDMLLWVRDQSPFAHIRSRLEELNLLEMNPSTANELDAEKLIAEITKDRLRKGEQSESVEVDRNTVVRNGANDPLPQPSGDEYRTRLHRFFPELNSGPQGFKNAGSKSFHDGQCSSEQDCNGDKEKVRAA
jgi:DNA-binding winged helix-turn-helix (wHTH) protein